MKSNMGCLALGFKSTFILTGFLHGRIGRRVESAGRQRTQALLSHSFAPICGLCGNQEISEQSESAVSIEKRKRFPRVEQCDTGIGPRCWGRMERVSKRKSASGSC